MERRDLLLARLDAIARSLRDSGNGLALFALGSAGLATARMDEFSDLDFFAIVQPGAKGSFLADLGWLGRVAPIAYSYRNTVDGHKVLFADGVFCEFAVFEPREIATIPFARGRVVWKAQGFDDAACEPASRPASPPADTAWLLGEALTSVYVGLSRLRRGEKLAAARAIQVSAVDAVVRLAASLERARPVEPDPFAPERRFELRFPGVGSELGSFMQGYEGSRESALAILSFLERHVPVNPAMAAAVRAMAGAANAGG